MSQAFTIHQFHYGASQGDAVTNQMLLIQKALNEGTTQGSIFSVERKHIAAEKVLPFRKEKIWDCDLLLIHHSQGNPILKELLNIEIPKALIYHNITPKQFYAHDPYVYELCKQGRKQIGEIKNKVVATFADSKYNADELTQEGFKSVQLLPLLDLSDELPSSTYIDLDPEAPKNILFVGRLSPHKNQRLLIETFFYLRQNLPKHSKLVIVGSGDPVYTHYLKLLTKQLGISQSVQFTGKVTETELGHLYAAADMLVCMSLHEGFCIPLVEAMKHSVPVAYLPEGAIPETMGKAGLRLETKSPVVLAEIIKHALTDAQVLEAILKSQLDRLEELKETQTSARIREKILPLLTTLHTRHLHQPSPVEMHAT